MSKTTDWTPASGVTVTLAVSAEACSNGTHRFHRSATLDGVELKTFHESAITPLPDDEHPWADMRLGPNHQAFYVLGITRNRQELINVTLLEFDSIHNLVTVVKTHAGPATGTSVPPWLAGVDLARAAVAAPSVKVDKPDVVSAELVRAIASGKVDIDRFVDPMHPVIIHSLYGGGACAPDDKRCLATAKAQFKPRTARTYIQAMVKQAETSGEPLTCDNSFMSAADPDFGRWTPKGDIDPALTGTPLRYATCTQAAAGEYGESFHLLFVPDAVRGVRLVAGVSSEQGSAMREWRAEIAKDVAAQPR